MQTASEVWIPLKVFFCSWCAALGLVCYVVSFFRFLFCADKNPYFPRWRGMFRLISTARLLSRPIGSLVAVRPIVPVLTSKRLPRRARFRALTVIP
jgi:hypothetical protein